MIRRLTPLSLIVGLIAAAAMAAAVAAAVRGPEPDWIVVAVLGALTVVASNRSVAFRDDAVFSADSMLVMASVVAFRPSGALLGPVLVGMCAGLDIAHFHQRAWKKVLFNCGHYGLGALAAAAVVWAAPESALASTPSLVLMVLAGAVAFSATTTVMLAAVLSLTTDEKFGSVLGALWRMHAQGLPFAVLGGFLGRLYLDVGLVIVPLFVTPMLVAREAFASYLALKQSHDDTVGILISALETKDPYTAGHAERVATFAGYIGSELGLSAKRLERLRLAALMHDVGKLVVPNHLLNKPGRLTQDEYSRVQLHEEVSVEILSRIDFLAPVAPSALSENTRFKPVSDSEGQPIEPHIVAVADAFDAMTSTRSYRKALPQATAFLELRENAGKQFHPRVVDALIVAIERRDEHYGHGHEIEPHGYSTEPPRTGTGSAGLGDFAADNTAGASGLAKP